LSITCRYIVEVEVEVEVGCISGRRVSVPMPKIDHNKVETDKESDGNAANDDYGN
jgi:hypothetical protein